MTSYLTREWVDNGTVGVHCYHRELETIYKLLIQNNGFTYLGLRTELDRVIIGESEVKLVKRKLNETK